MLTVSQYIQHLLLFVPTTRLFYEVNNPLSDNAVSNQVVKSYDNRLRNIRKGLIKLKIQ